jgi:sporadic carbohydrate cluster 2OG-Fe(II) oxygenase
MARLESFISPEEDALAEEFLQRGYVIRGAENVDGLHEIRHQVVVLACAHLSCDMPEDEEDFLNHIYKVVSVEKLNDLRIAIYGQINSHSWFRPTFFSLARSVVEALVGNELAMQNRVNLSIQMPEDDSSLLGIHSDSFSGETPFQVVEWVPLVDVFETKAMFLLPPEFNRQRIPEFKFILERGGMELLWNEVKDDLVWVEVPYGKVLIFSPNLLHGNIVNSTSETRWSFNCRITGLFTPYASSGKSLGGFYLPITTKVVSRIGMNYRAPEGLGG